MHVPLSLALWLATGLGPAGQCAQETAGAYTIPWRVDLGAARTEAAVAGKPLLILVRCPP